MTPQDIIPPVRRVLNDENASSYRWSDAELLGWINACINVMVDLRPDLFSAQETHVCTAGPRQEVTFDRVRLVQEVVRITDGAAILPVDREVFDRYNPSWYTGSSGPAANWMPHPASPKRFYLYPPSPAGQHVEVVYIRAHVPITAITDTINLPENYAPAIQAFVVYRAESKDDEQINTSRAQAFMSDFAGMVGASKGA